MQPLLKNNISEQQQSMNTTSCSFHCLVYVGQKLLTMSLNYVLPIISALEKVALFVRPYTRKCTNSVYEVIYIFLSYTVYSDAMIYQKVDVVKEGVT